jgi:large subunit ribosomal protein LP0
MGKNTMIRKCIKDYCERKGDNTWMSLYEKMVGNVGVIFTSGELDAVKEKIKEFVVPAPAKAGAIAQVDVTVEAGPTGMEPSQTNFFQTLNIATKINKGAIEILSDVKVLSKGDKVTTSAAALLGKLGVTPFFYGLEAMFVYDNGNVFDVAVLDISDEDITAMFGAGLKNIAALSLQANYPTIAAVPHAIINGSAPTTPSPSRTRSRSTSPTPARSPPRRPPPAVAAVAVPPRPRRPSPRRRRRRRWTLTSSIKSKV